MKQTTNDQARGNAHAKSLAEQKGTREDKHAVADEAARQQEGSDSNAPQQGSERANNEERPGRQRDDAGRKTGPQSGQGQFGSPAPGGGGPDR